MCRTLPLVFCLPYLVIIRRFPVLSTQSSRQQISCCAWLAERDYGRIMDDGIRLEYLTLAVVVVSRGHVRDSHEYWIRDAQAFLHLILTFLDQTRAGIPV